MNLKDLFGNIENKDPEPSGSHTVILWGPDDLLAQAMEFFLKAGQSWNVIRMASDQSLDSLFEQTKRIHPDVVILYTGNCVSNSTVPMQMVEEHPNLRVVTASLEDNHMQVYSKQSFMLRKASDLLSIIEDSNFSDHPNEKGDE